MYESYNNVLETKENMKENIDSLQNVINNQYSQIEYIKKESIKNLQNVQQDKNELMQNLQKKFNEEIIEYKK